MTKFVNRQDLIRATADGTLTAEQIAGLSEEDREFAELLREFRVAGADRLVDAPETVIRKAEAIIELAKRPSSLSALVAKLVFDSWAMPLPTGVRGTATADERRVRFEATPYLLDLRVEKQGGRYHCTAELAQAGSASRPVAVVADKKVVHAGSEGLFEWSSTHPPRSLALRIDEEQTVVLPELSWNKPTQS